MTEEKTYKRSVSQLKQVMKCGEAFAISRGFRGHRPPQRPWAQTVGGIAFHRMIVDWEKSGRKVDYNTLFDQYWNEELDRFKEEQPDLSLWMKPPPIKTAEKAIDSVYKRFKARDIPNYIRRCEEADWEIYKFPNGDLALELDFTVDFNGVVVRGTVDRIQWWPSNKLITIEDTKTGSPDDEADARQLGLYRLGIQERYGLNVTRGRYWFTKVDRGGEWVDLRRYDWDYLAGTYLTLNEIIGQNLFLPNPGKQCKLCDVRPWCEEMGWLKPGEELDGSY